MLINNPLYIQDLDRVIESVSIPDEKNLLVTGASGLIGSFLVDVFIRFNQTHHKNLQIYALGRSGDRLAERFRYAANCPYLHFISQDICIPLSGENYDYIIHAASNADPGSYARYPVETIAANVLGTWNILNYAKSHSETHILFTSTMEVYGSIPDKEIFSENDFGLIDYNLIRSGYPESKRTAELLIRSFVEEYGVNAVIARLGYIYGPTMTVNDNKVVAQFIRKAIAGEDIILKSKGQQMRSYCYIADAALGILTVLFKGQNGEAYNVANYMSVLTIADLANIVADISKSQVRYELPDYLEQKGFGNIQDAVLSTDKLSSLNYRPRYTIQEGLERTISILKSI